VAQLSQRSRKFANDRVSENCTLGLLTVRGSFSKYLNHNK
jgi:hypothetical protein